jgi:hypothetical protein
MSAYSPVSAPTEHDQMLVLAMLANRIPLTLLPDLAWLTDTTGTDFAPTGSPC